MTILKNTRLQINEQKLIGIRIFSKILYAIVRFKIMSTFYITLYVVIFQIYLLLLCNFTMIIEQIQMIKAC